jgi:hypothetical protein
LSEFETGFLGLGFFGQDAILVGGFVKGNTFSHLLRCDMLQTRRPLKRIKAQKNLKYG